MKLSDVDIELLRSALEAGLDYAGVKESLISIGYTLVFAVSLKPFDDDVNLTWLPIREILSSAGQL